MATSDCLHKRAISSAIAAGSPSADTTTSAVWRYSGSRNFKISIISCSEFDVAALGPSPTASARPVVARADRVALQSSPERLGVGVQPRYPHPRTSQQFPIVFAQNHAAAGRPARAGGRSHSSAKIAASRRRKSGLAFKDENLLEWCNRLALREPYPRRASPSQSWSANRRLATVLLPRTAIADQRDTFRVRFTLNTLLLFRLAQRDRRQCPHGPLAERIQRHSFAGKQLTLQRPPGG